MREASGGPDLAATLRAHHFIRTLTRLGAAAKTAEPWRAIAPMLTVSDRPPSDDAPAIDDAWARDPLARERFAAEGFVVTPPIVPPETVACLRGGIETLIAAKVPAGFIFMFDEAYALYAALARAIAPLTGPLVLMAEGCWGFWVPPADRGVSRWTAYEAHRDWMGPDAEAMAGRVPQSLVAWVALSDATTHDSCVYVVPADADSGYAAGQRAVTTGMFRVQDARAVPVRAGQVLLMSSHLAHWTGRSSSLATHPRIALSALLRAVSTLPPDEAAFVADAPVPVEERLRGLIPTIREATRDGFDALVSALQVELRPRARRY